MDKETGKQYSIIIVDDDSFLLNMYSTKFTNSGFDVTVSTSGVEALDKLREGLQPDVIVMDIIMPTMDGLEVLEHIKREGLAKNTLIIMLTNQGDAKDVERAKALGISGYIVKATSVPSEVVDQVLAIVKQKGTS